MRARVLALLLAPAIVLGLLAGCNADGTLKLPTGVVYPSIEPATGTADLTVNQTFRFEGAPRTVSVLIDGEVYAGAKRAEKSVIRFGKAHENDWIEEYYPAFVFEKHQEAFFSALIGQFRAIRDADGLDSDRYVELMTAYVQSLTYKTDAVNLSPKFPVETAAERAGDCDDKALLLGAMLAREGYDVAILLFGPEQHVALGIRADGPGYSGTGYAYIETTTQGFVGMPPESLGNGERLASTPQVFRLGDGSAAYGAAAQVTEILAAADAAARTAADLAPRVKAADAGLASLEIKTRDLSARLNALAAAGDTAGYNELVPAYNAAASDYNEAVAQRNALAKQYDEAGRLHNHIMEHLDDRVGVIQFIRANR